MTAPLAIEPALPRVAAALADAGAAVLVAAPGAGKTTRVPLALLDAPWLGGRKIVDAGAAAARRARRRATHGAARSARRSARPSATACGSTRRVGPRTRVEVRDRGLFLRRLQRDPALEGVGAVIFDEFHERGLDADLGAGARASRRSAALRPDLRLLVMSATLDGAARGARCSATRR